MHAQRNPLLIVPHPVARAKYCGGARAHACVDGLPDDKKGGAVQETAGKQCRQGQTQLPPVLTVLQHAQASVPLLINLSRAAEALQWLILGRPSCR